MSELSSSEFKTLVKTALKEWMDEKFLEFGRYSFRALMTLGLVALIYFILVMNGWRLQ